MNNASTYSTSFKRKYIGINYFFPIFNEFFYTVNSTAEEFYFIYTNVKLCKVLIIIVLTVNNTETNKL